MTTQTITPGNGPAIEGSVTGRDGYVTIKGLLYAVAAIQALPDDRQEWSDMHDMCALVLSRCRDARDFWAIIWGIESHIGRQIELWPDSEAMTEEDESYRDAMRAWISEQQAKFEASLSALDAPASSVVDFIEAGE